MATHKPELHSMDAVLSYFDQFDNPAYQVFAGTNPKPDYCRFTYTGQDKGIGREKLQEALLAVANNPDNTNTYLLQILAEKGKKFEPVNSITFQLNKYNSMYPAVMQGMNNNYVNNEILSKLKALEEKISYMESDEEEEEEEKPDFIAGLMNNPQIQSLIMGFIGNLFNNNNTKLQAMAGIPETESKLTTEATEEEKIATAIEILSKNTTNLGDKLLKLAQMSIDNPSQYYMLVRLL